MVSSPCEFRFRFSHFLGPPHHTTMAASDDQDWDDFCLDPFRSAREDGERLGEEAGLEAGFREGHGLGIITGTEYGMELGFYKGVCSAVAAHQEVLEDRTKKTVADLRLALDDFPGPDQVFRERQQQQHQDQHTNDDEGHEHGQHAAEPHGDDDDDSEHPAAASNSSSEANIPHKMQRIRARFKLLTVQLGIPHFSLKLVFDEAARASAITTAPDTSDW
jgi:hypothetical protein